LKVDSKIRVNCIELVQDIPQGQIRTHMVVLLPAPTHPILRARNDLLEIETAISQMPVGSYFPACRFLIPLRFMDFLAN